MHLLPATRLQRTWMLVLGAHALSDGEAMPKFGSLPHDARNSWIAFEKVGTAQDAAAITSDSGWSEHGRDYQFEGTAN